MGSEIDSLFDLSGKVAVITGGGGALCSVMSRSLGAHGVKVAVLDIDSGKAEKVADKIIRTGGQAMAMKCNVLEPEDLHECRQAVERQWGRIDLLIPGAGGNDPAGTTSEEFLELKEQGKAGAHGFFDLEFSGFAMSLTLISLELFQPFKLFHSRWCNREKAQS